MKIAYVYDVVHPYVIGGVQKRIWEVATRLSRRGHDVTIFGMKYWDGNVTVNKEGVRLWGVCPPEPLFANGRRSISEPISFARHLLPPLMKERYDIIDVANFPYFPCFTAAFHHVMRGSQLVITWHEVWDDYWSEYLGKKGGVGKAIERMTAHLPHRAIAVSSRTSAGLQRLGCGHVEVVPSGVDLRAIRELPPSPTAADIIFVGRMTKEKNIPLLIESMRLLTDQGKGLSCLLVGAGPEETRLQTMITDMSLQNSIHMRDDIEDDAEVLSYMKSSRVLALPSVREGLGLVVVEANACGIPAVVAKHPNSAAADLIVEGQNGFICQLSAADMADKIMKAIDRRDSWADSCMETARRYDWEAIVDSLERVYRGS